MEDRKIIEMLLERNENAISAISKRYKGICYKIAHNILKNHEDTEECINDSYFKVWNSIPPAIPESLTAFIGKIARNTALNIYERSAAKKRGKGTINAISNEILESFPEIHDWEKIIDNIHLKELINEFLENLPSEKRIVFLQRYWYICSLEQISFEHGFSKSKTKMMVLRVRGELKEFLEKEGVQL